MRREAPDGSFSAAVRSRAFFSAIFLERAVLSLEKGRKKGSAWSGLGRVAGPAVGKPADVDVAGVTAMAGAGARLYADVLGRPLLELDQPDPAVLAGCAADRIRAGAPSERLTPLYLRRPDVAEPVPRKPVRT